MKPPHLLDDEADNQARYDRMIRMHQAGLTYQAIADEYGLTKQRVAQIIARPRPNRGSMPDGPDNREIPDADPADGRAIGRCLSCGLPGRSEPLMTFELYLMPGHKRAGYYRLCGPCFRHANPDPRPDPLAA